MIYVLRRNQSGFSIFQVLIFHRSRSTYSTLYHSHLYLIINHKVSIFLLLSSIHISIVWFCKVSTTPEVETSYRHSIHPNYDLIRSRMIFNYFSTYLYVLFLDRYICTVYTVRVDHSTNPNKTLSVFLLLLSISREN